MHKPAYNRLFIRQGGCRIAEEPQQVTSSVKRVRDQTSGYSGTDGMKLKLK